MRLYVELDLRRYTTKELKQIDKIFDINDSLKKYIKKSSQSRKIVTPTFFDAFRYDFENVNKFKKIRYGLIKEDDSGKFSKEIIEAKIGSDDYNELLRKIYYS